MNVECLLRDSMKTKPKEQPWCTSENFHPEECNTNEL